ncbi:DEAD/DEAH box helicase family protein [Evansella cellulosilytica]|uniref:Type III restriction protein res subunit n=1 Tax=Evansella cellulosilytica (strain ATCC 21833 / DSM 2522 / FERM P-1141 / JCM 9156 / N-4) TaxID=649639 RepID=E6TR02_EVAC2|nr:DEAD/DEAH box helicase family protein [Evansella cellulosilytica]ADU29378.1 type III restriction protein res subunit [Evansella cellulosilytica DSM 2522]
MKEFPGNIQFCHPWRSYQQEVLDHLDHHLANKHLHLVAPPGSGKTVLGLEVMLRLGKPTLIVAPTLAIRNQWVSRFVELFLQANEQPTWISTDLRNPKFITVTTYQGLHSIFQKKGEKETSQDVIDDEEMDESSSEVDPTDKELAQQKLIDEQFQTLILDEAHHLRTSWWRTTLSFRNKLHDPTVVSLTATPPYDVGKSEWDKYMELCGPIDEEIEVAALVKEGDLCPHQDYVWMSEPSKKEKEPIDTFHQEAEELKKRLLENHDFQKLIESHPWIQSEEYVDEKLSNHGYFTSMILYLKEIGSEAWEQPFQLLNEKAKNLPNFDMEWTEELLTNMLYRDKWIDPKEEPMKSIRKQLSTIGALERRRVKLIATRAMERTLLHSVSKLDSITSIVSLEKQSKQESLRLVVLADYIYADDLPKDPSDNRPLIRLGVIPVFEKIRRELGEQCRLGVLTGSVVILPQDVVPILNEKHVNFNTEVLPHDDRYVKVTIRGASRQNIVSIVTDIFSQGKVDVLIGTTALLGEGWDAPSVNTLILASYVGTFMLTNQMRGRAIRTEQGNPEKAANIWHLVCVDSNTGDGGHDYYSLIRRFRSLKGLDEELPLISTGINRLRFPDSRFDQNAIELNNQEMARRASNRSRLMDRWQEAVQQGKAKREEVQVDKSFIPRPFVFHNTVKSLLIITLLIMADSLRAIGEGPRYSNLSQLGLALLIVLSIGVVLSSPFWWRALRIIWFNKSIESSMKQVGIAIYHSLYDTGMISTPPSQNIIHVHEMPGGFLKCSLEHGSTHEQILFFQSLQEVVDPIDNPRYIIHRQSGKRFWVRHDYHAVPHEIGRKKESAEILLNYWQKKVGKAELVFTRTPEGRKLLLKARMRAMSSKFVSRSERISVWK